MKVVVAYYSWSGNTEKVAKRILENLSGHSVSIQRIVPVKERGYKTWLTLSFFPGSCVPILPLDFDVVDSDLVILGCPKWTFSCPPFNEFVKRLKNQGGKNVVFFTTFGGFGEERYVASTERRLRKAGLNVLAHFMIRRREIQTGEYVSSVDKFCKGLLSGIETGLAED